MRYSSIVQSAGSHKSENRLDLVEKIIIRREKPIRISETSICPNAPYSLSRSALGVFKVYIYPI